ncbi:HNH endonuclease [candidate division KSB1 bacterium]
MMGEFNRKEVAELLAECHRRCCICHKFCVTKIETDHITPKDQGGKNDIDNAIPVCFDCHAEIHTYNDLHPRGRKFSPEELKKHKQQWLKTCQEKPEVLLKQSIDSGVGPLQSLIDELEFNLKITENPVDEYIGCPFYDNQFKLAIHKGAISMLRDELKKSIIEAYYYMCNANQKIISIHQLTIGQQEMRNRAQQMIKESRDYIEKAYSALLDYLKSEDKKNIEL